ncbi:hypothetical protein SAY87_015521 [Trapa incisa]|uniref:Uncharacterized protein n=1 Tax=Trapa incisa TaxID=236973 RepID=A0AAN7GZI1_9MYRT|nr:hypothetical protein SAY87_015521 [Trapa incisa]
MGFRFTFATVQDLCPLSSGPQNTQRGTGVPSVSCAGRVAIRTGPTVRRRGRGKWSLLGDVLTMEAAGGCTYEKKLSGGFDPAGVDMLMKAVGKDSTSLFILIRYPVKYHAWENDQFLLERCLVGIIDENQ